jgi:hypothetical protein
MKNIMYFAGLITLASLMASCEQQDVLRYDPSRAAIEFQATGAGTAIGGRTFTFRSLDAGETEAILSIPFNIVGYPAPFDRHAVFSVLNDSTSESAQYEILDAIVPANSYGGALRVRVTNNQGANFKDVRIWFCAEQGKDFMHPGQSGPGYNNYILRLTNSLVRPAEWFLDGTDQVNARLGAYSTAYYAFIIQETGETRFPFSRRIAGYNLDENGDPQIWPPSYAWMVLYKIMEALKTLNAEREAQGLDPMPHDDGHAAGQPIIVGNIYQNLLRL